MKALYRGCIVAYDLGSSLEEGSLPGAEAGAAAAVGPQPSSRGSLRADCPWACPAGTEVKVDGGNPSKGGQR